MGYCGILVRRAWAELWRVPVEYANEGVSGFRQQGFSRLALEVGMEEGELRGVAHEAGVQGFAPSL